MTVLRVLWRFLVDLVIGDDPKVALAVMAALAVSAALLVTTDLGDAGVTTAGAALVMMAFAVVLLVDVRRSRE